jgi:hypothetical protein
MRRNTLIAGLVFAIAALSAAPVMANEPAKADVDQSVKLSPVALPIIVNGRLANYVFVTVKILLTPQADANALRDKEPYFRDALVRAGHRTPFVLASDYNHLDEARLKAAVYRDAVAIAGQRAIQGVQVVEQTPQHHLSGPH